MAWLRIVAPGVREVAYELPAPPAPDAPEGAIDERQQAIEVAKARHRVATPEQVWEAEEAGSSTAGLVLATVNETLPVDDGYDPEVVRGEWWR